MKLFGLTPQQAIDRIDIKDIAPQKSMLYSMLFGSIGFGIVSALAYSIWAFRIVRGQGPMYTAIALVYLGLAGWVFGRLLIIPKSQSRFFLLFASGFFIYAVVWCLFWFGLTSRYHSDLYGSAVGLLAFAALFNKAFGVTGKTLTSFVGLFAFHTIGYYIGDDLNNSYGGRVGKMLWGAFHGIGFGAGLGFLLHTCQSGLRQRILKMDTNR